MNAAWVFNKVSIGVLIVIALGLPMSQNFGLAEDPINADFCSIEKMDPILKAYILKQPKEKQDEGLKQCRELVNKINSTPVDPESTYSKQSYAHKLNEKIYMLWATHRELPNQNVQIRFELEPAGKLVKVVTHKSSGNQNLDKIVISILEGASPFESFQGKSNPNRQYLLDATGSSAVVYQISDIVDSWNSHYLGDTVSNAKMAIEKSLKGMLPEFPERFITGLIMTVDQDGRVKNIKIHHPSGNSVIDNQLRKIVADSGPYLPYLSPKIPSADIYVSFQGYFIENPDRKQPIINVETHSLGLASPETPDTLIMEKYWMVRNITYYWDSASVSENLQASFSFNVVPNGEIAKFEVHESSGNPQFDESASQALKSAAPFIPYSPSKIGVRSYRAYMRAREVNLISLSYPDTESALNPASTSDNCCIGDSYRETVLALISKHWIPPNYHYASPIYLRLLLTPKGEIQEIKMETTSGIPEFDTYAINAVKKAAPYPLYKSENTPYTVFPLKFITYGMKARNTFSNAYRSDRKEYFEINAKNTKEAVPDQRKCMNLDKVPSNTQDEASVIKRQLQAVVKEQIAIYNRYATMETPPELKALEKRLKIDFDARRKDIVPLGPGNALVRFSIAPDGYPVAVYTIKSQGNKAISGHEKLLSHNAESAVLKTGPYKGKSPCYDVTVTYP